MTRGATWSRIALALMLVVAITTVTLNRDALNLAAIESRLHTLGPWAPAAFVVLWAVWALAFLPGSVLGIAGGALFGPVWGAVWNLLGATLAASLAFLAARYIASDWIARTLGGRLKVLLEGIEAEGWRFVALVRLVPMFPFSLTNYALGLTRIRFSTYGITSFVCMIPAVIALTYLGFAGREMLAGGEALIKKGVLAIALLAAAGLLPHLVRRFRQPRHTWIEAEDLKNRLDRGEPMIVLDVRGPHEFNGPLGHLYGARNIPIDSLASRVDELVALKTAPIIVVCKTDKRSAKAAGILQAAGYSQVLVLRSGIEQWHREGFHVECLPSALNR